MIGLALLALATATADPGLCLELARGGKLEESVKACTASLDSGPGDRSLLYTVRGESYRRLGELDRAVADFSAAIDFDPTAVLAWANRGAALLERGDTGGALRDFDRALALDPANVLAAYNRGLIRAGAGETDLAIEDFTRAIHLDPDLAQAYLQRGLCYSRQAEHARSAADLTAAIAKRQDYAQAYHNRAVAWMELGELDAALADADRAVALSPGNTLALFSKAVILLSRQDSVAAAGVLRALTASAPDDEYLALQLAVATRAAAPAEREAARSALERVVRQPAGAEWIRAVSLLVLTAEGASEDAVAAKAQADKDPLAVARAAFFLGELRLQRGDVEGARRSFLEGAKPASSQYVELSLCRARVSALAPRPAPTPGSTS